VLPVTLTAEGQADPVFSALDESFPALQWHGDTFDVPSGGVHLGSSAAYRNQAFRFGAVAYAVQFHVEVTDHLLNEWQHVPAYRESARSALGESGFESLARAFSSASSSMAASATRLFNGWLDHCGLTGNH
jgi:GMP synthase-like glutamine amidotransferase